MNELREYGDRMSGQWRIFAWGGIAALLALAWVLQSMTGSPEWTMSDYVVAAGLLAVPLVIYELAQRKSPLWSYRAGAALGLCASAMLVWINGAVGIIGSEDNPANLMYAGVLVIALSGAFVARFEAEGLVRTMRAAALGHVVITLIAIAGGMGLPSTGPLKLIAINAFFIAFWWTASMLFSMAAGQGASSGETQP